MMSEGEGGQIALTVQRFVELLRSMHGLSPDQDTALIARVKQLQRLNLFLDAPVGRGRVELLSLQSLLRGVFIFELASVGMPTALAGSLAKAHWATCLSALLVGWQERRLKAAQMLYLCVEHSALSGAGRPKKVRTARGFVDAPVSALVTPIRLRRLSDQLAQRQARHSVLLRPSQIVNDVSVALTAGDYPLEDVDAQMIRLGNDFFEVQSPADWPSLGQD